MTPPLTLAAIRFSDDVPAMRRFLEALGLAAVSTRGEGWAVLEAGAGQVWLHDAAGSTVGAPAGCTALTGEIADADAYAQQLEAQGLEPSIIDEAFARSVEVTDPLGRRLAFNAGDSDGYGYTPHDAEPDKRITVSMCRFTDPQGDYAHFAETLGLRREGEPNRWYVPYTAGTGILGLHHDDGSDALPDDGTSPMVTLGLTTSMPLDEVQGRLREGGYDAGKVVTEDFGSRVESTDPDGQPLQIHAAAQS